MSITVQLPLNQGSDSIYNNIDDIRDYVKQNVKNVLLTVPGERVMLPDFGVGLKRYLFENYEAANTAAEIRSTVEVQFARYLPTVILHDIRIVEEGHALLVKVFYGMTDVNLQDFLEIVVIN